MPDPAPAGAQQCRLDPPLLDEQPGNQQQRVSGEHGVLDRQHHDAAAAHQQRPIHVAQDRVEARLDVEGDAIVERVIQASREGRGVAPHPVDVLDGKPVEVRQGAQLQADVPGCRPSHQVVGADDERPVSGERGALGGAVDLERLAVPVRIGRVAGFPDPGDPDLQPPVAASLAGERHLVAHGETEVLGDSARDGDLHGIGTIGRELAGDQVDVAIEPLVGGEQREVGPIIGRLVRERVGLRLPDADQLAAGPAEDAAQLAVDLRLDVGQLVGRNARVDRHRRRHGRLVGEHLSQAGEGDRVTVEDADGHQRRRAQDHQPRRGHDQPVGEAALDDNAKRGHQALGHPGPPCSIRRARGCESFTKGRAIVADSGHAHPPLS